MIRNYNVTWIIIKLIIIKSSIITMPASIFDSLHWNIIVRLHHPHNNQLSSERFCHRSVNSQIQHLITRSNYCSQWCVNSNINRLAKWGTSDTDVLDFHISFWIEPTNDDVMWHWYKSNTRNGIIFSVFCNVGFENFSKKSSISPSFIYTFSKQ